MNELNCVKQNKRLWLYVSAMAQLWIELNGYLKHKPLIQEVLPSTSFIEAEYRQPETIGQIPSKGPKTITTPLSRRLFVEMIRPGVIDKSWLMIYGYDETNDILYWWSTEMIYTYQQESHS